MPAGISVMRPLSSAATIHGLSRVVDTMVWSETPRSTRASWSGLTDILPGLSTTRGRHINSTFSLRSWLRDDSDVRPRRLPAVRVRLLRLFVRHRSRNDDIVAVLPLGRRRNLVFRRQLQRVDDTKHLVEVAPGRHRVDEDQFDLLVGPDHKDIADRLIVRRGAPLARGFEVGREHPVQFRHLEIRVADHRVVRRVSLRFLYVGRPALMVVDGVDAEADDLHVALVELRLDARHVAELGRAHRREILRVREQHRPRIADPNVTPDASLGGFGLEVSRDVTDLERHGTPPSSESEYRSLHLQPQP